MKRTITVGLLLFTGCSSFDETAAKGYWKQSDFNTYSWDFDESNEDPLHLAFQGLELRYVFGDYSSDFSDEITPSGMNSWRKNLWSECDLGSTDFNCSPPIETIHYAQWATNVWEALERVEETASGGDPTGIVEAAKHSFPGAMSLTLFMDTAMVCSSTALRFFLVSSYNFDCFQSTGSSYSLSVELTSTMVYQDGSTTDPHEVDDDGDGFTEKTGDCNDSDAEINPDASEISNYLDDDCDGIVDDETPTFDDDGDGYTEEGGDCDDSNLAISPDATEVVNEVDDDCDGAVDEDTVVSDDDEDGFSENDGDCNDRDPSTYPGAALNDSASACMTDADGDGFGSDEPAAGGEAGTDCDDPIPRLILQHQSCLEMSWMTIAMATLMKNKQARFLNGEQVLSISIWWIQLYNARDNQEVLCG